MNIYREQNSRCKSLFIIEITQYSREQKEKTEGKYKKSRVYIARLLSKALSEIIKRKTRNNVTARIVLLCESSEKKRKKYTYTSFQFSI